MKRIIKLFSFIFVVLVLAACKAKYKLELKQTELKVKTNETFVVSLDYEGELIVSSSDESIVKVLSLSELKFQALEREGIAVLTFQIKKTDLKKQLIITVEKPTVIVEEEFTLTYDTGAFTLVGAFEKTRKFKKDTAIGEDALKAPQIENGDNYEFKGWFTEPNGAGTKLDANFKLAANTTIYVYFVEKEPESVIKDPELYVTRYNIYERKYEFEKRSITELKVLVGQVVYVPVVALNVPSWESKVRIEEVGENPCLHVNGFEIEALKTSSEKRTLKITVEGYPKLQRLLKVEIEKPNVDITGGDVYLGVEQPLNVNVSKVVGNYSATFGTPQGTGEVEIDPRYNNKIYVTGKKVGQVIIPLEVAELGLKKNVAINVKPLPEKGLKYGPGAVQELNQTYIRLGEKLLNPYLPNHSFYTVNVEFKDPAQNEFTFVNNYFEPTVNATTSSMQKLKITVGGPGTAKVFEGRISVKGAVLVTVDSENPTNEANLTFNTFKEAYNTFGGNTTYKVLKELNLTEPIEIKHSGVRLVTVNSEIGVNDPGRLPEVIFTGKIVLGFFVNKFEISGFTWNDAQVVGKAVPKETTEVPAATSAEPKILRNGVYVYNNIINNNIAALTDHVKKCNNSETVPPEKDNPELLEKMQTSFLNSSICFWEIERGGANYYERNVQIVGNKFLAGSNKPYCAVVLDNTVNLRIESNEFVGWDKHAIFHDANSKGLASDPAIIDNKFLMNGKGIAFLSTWTTPLNSDGESTSITFDGNTFENADVGIHPGATNSSVGLVSYSISYNTFKNVKAPLEIFRNTSKYNMTITENKFIDCEHVIGSDDPFFQGKDGKPFALGFTTFYFTVDKANFVKNALIRSGEYKEFDEETFFGEHWKHLKEKFDFTEINNTRIKSSAEEGVYVKPTFEVKPKNIKLLFNELLPLVGSIYTVECEVNPVDGAFPVIWQSSDSETLEVVQDSENKYRAHLIAKKTGVVTLKVKTNLGTSDDIEKTIEVAVVNPKDVRIILETNVLKKGDTTKVSAAFNQDLDGVNSFEFTSFNEGVASVSATGEVTAKGKGEATIKAKFGAFEKQFKIVVYEEVDEAFQFVINSHKAQAFHEITRACASCEPYFFEYNGKTIDPYSQKVWWFQPQQGSVSRVLYSPLNTVKSYLNETDQNTFLNFKNGSGDNVLPGEEINYNDPTRPVFIVVHDTGNTVKGSTAQANINYITNPSNTASWHFIADDKGIYRVIDEKYQVWHAGDGGDAVLPLIDTKVLATSEKPFVTLTSDNKFIAIDGKATTIGVGSKAKGIARCGIHIEKGANGNWFIQTPYTHRSGYVCTKCGLQSLAMEGVVERGSDYYLMWHNQAKLTAELMDKHNIPIQRVMTHNNCSNKDCASALINAVPGELGYLPEFKQMVLAEQEFNRLVKLGYTFELSSTSNLIDNRGHFKFSPITNEEVDYTVKIKKGETIIGEITLYTHIISRYNLSRWWETPTSKFVNLEKYNEMDHTTIGSGYYTDDCGHHHDH